MMTPATGARLLTATAFLCACAPTLPAAGQAAADPRDERIQRELASHLDSLSARDVFSGAVLVARGDRPIFVRAYGRANERDGIANTTDTQIAKRTIRPK